MVTSTLNFHFLIFRGIVNRIIIIMQSQYKSVIQFVQQYKNFYAKFKAYLHRNEGLIQNSFMVRYMTKDKKVASLPYSMLAQKLRLDPLLGSSVFS